jgi:ubiquinone/menaquinone biosynthesis C-methylase UbiE
MSNEKIAVKDFWNENSCGELLYLKGEDEIEAFNYQSSVRYELEPYILKFADFASASNKKVLEIGVGLGADHQKFAEAGAYLTGIDLTDKAISHTKRRFSIFNLNSELIVADAENLPFANESFDIIYSWGVIHHSPDTPKAVNEIFRVLRQNGEARIMIYHTRSIVGYMLWLRYGLFRLNPFMTLREVYDKYLESPGTKAYTIKEARQMFAQFSIIQISTILTHGDLLTSEAGQRHRGILLVLAKKIFPRAIIKMLLPRHGLFMMIKATK